MWYDYIILKAYDAIDLYFLKGFRFTLMRVAVAADSNSGLIAAEAQAQGIFLLPMPILIGESCYLEGQDIDAEKLFEAMEQGRSCSTSQPSPGSVGEFWNSILAQGYDEIVYIPMTSGLSGSCASAMMLAEEYAGRVHVADNRRISFTQAEAVLEACRMAQTGFSAGEIKAYLEETALQASIYITVDSLKYLQKGGRLSATAAVLGTVLNIKPILSIQGENIEAFAKVRGMKQCEKRMMEAIENDIATRFSNIPVQNLRIGAAGTLRTQAEIDHWQNVVRAAFPGSSVNYVALPCSIACHVGPGCMGVAVSVAQY